MSHLVRRSLLLLGGVGLFAVLFQNCDGGFQVLESMDNASSAFQVATCLFNGQPILAGSSVTAYQLPNASSAQACVSETRTCSNGILSGSYANASCLVTLPGDCALGALKVTNGATVTGYSALQVAAGQDCSSVAATATCTNGVLSTKIYPTCSVATPTSCQFNGQYVPDGVSITTYLASAVPYGALCNPQLRTCSNGVLSGSFPAATCTAAAAASCKYGTSTIANGDSVQAFTTNVVPYGQSCTSAQTSITCKNGVFAFADGTSATYYYYTSCLPASTTTCQFGGKTLQTGDSASGYLKTFVPADQLCALTTATCNGGVITGLPKTPAPVTTPRMPGVDPNANVGLYPTCYVGGCTYNGNPVPNQTTVTAYSTPVVGYSQSCTSVQIALTCNNGTLRDSSGNPTANFYGLCRPATSSSCSISNYVDNTSISIASGQTVTGYTSTSVLEGNTCASVQKNVSCNDGIISLTGVAQGNSLAFYFYNSCNVGACTISKQSVLNGSTVTAYASSYVGYGQSCSSVQATLTCRNSTLFNANGAAYNYTTTCTPVPTPNCIVNDYANRLADINIPNGQAITGYTTGSAGPTCPNYKVTLSCSNGLFSRNGGAATSPNSGIFYSTCK